MSYAMEAWERSRRHARSIRKGRKGKKKHPLLVSEETTPPAHKIRFSTRGPSVPIGELLWWSVTRWRHFGNRNEARGTRNEELGTTQLRKACKESFGNLL